jgi:hypothetical protein
VEARLLRVDGDQLHIGTRDGRQFALPLDGFSDSDRQCVRQDAARQPESPKKYAEESWENPTSYGSSESREVGH